MNEKTATAWLSICMLVSIAFDIAACVAWWLEKPWHLVVGLVVIGALNHPSAQLSLKQWAMPKTEGGKQP